MRKLKKEIVLFEDGKKNLELRRKFNSLLTGGMNLIKTLEGHSERVTSVTFSPDGSKVASGSWDNTVKLWDVQSGQCLQTLEGHSASVTSVAFGAKGSKVASGSIDRSVKLWDVTSGECLQTLEGHSYYSVNSVSFSPDGTKLASGSGDGTIKIWEDPRVQERRREMKEMMRSLSKANRRRRDRAGNLLPSEAGRKVYQAKELGKKIGEFL